jgi:hypothetical protein
VCAYSTFQRIRPLRESPTKSCGADAFMGLEAAMIAGRIALVEPKD